MPNIIRMRVYDQPGVLDRITGLIRRHGINIKTITSGNVSDGISQITISLGDHAKLDALGDKFREMSGVRQFEKCTPESHLIRELLLARFTEEQRYLIGADMRIVREEGGMIFAECVAAPPTIDATIMSLRSQGVACARGGAIGIPLTEGEL